MKHFLTTEEYKEKKLGKVGTDIATLNVSGDKDKIQISVGGDGSYEVYGRWYDYSKKLSDAVPDEIYIKIRGDEDLKKMGNVPQFEQFVIEGNDEKLYTVHDNGGRPFTLRVDKDLVDIYQQKIRYTDVKKVFYGDKKDKNSTILIETEDGTYIWVGNNGVQSFKLDEKIVDFKTPIGNSDVPYVVAIGKVQYYFLTESSIVRKDDFDKLHKSGDDMYKTFYDNKDTLNTTKMQMKELIKRSY